MPGPFHAPRAQRSHLVIKPMIKWLLLLPLAWLVSVAKEPLDPKICLQPLPIAAYTDRQTTPPRIPALAVGPRFSSTGFYAASPPLSPLAGASSHCKAEHAA